MFSVNTTPQELENGSFTLKKRSKCFLSTLRGKNLKRNSPLT